MNTSENVKPTFLDLIFLTSQIRIFDVHIKPSILDKLVEANHSMDWKMGIIVHTL